MILSAHAVVLALALLAAAPGPTAWADDSVSAVAPIAAPAAPASRAARAQSADLADLAQSREWQVLLHERRSWLGRDRSEADGPGFFLSPVGKTDAEAELRADLDAFRAGGEAACKFPARFRLLRERLDPRLRFPTCPEFTKWKAQFHAKVMIVVYAAPYLGSPASMFGHTFLRLSSQEASTAPLDPSISYEAATLGDDGPVMAVKGLLGFYPGVFSLQPYHLKMNLYSNLEARDLWEYELRLTPSEIDRMLDHAWELGSTYFNYYFFNTNCSYQLLSLVEAARPELRLRERFSAMTVPADTLRVLSQVGLVRRVTRRPSLIDHLERRLSVLSPAERHRFDELRGHLELLGRHEAPGVLDALLDWEEFRVVVESKTLFDAAHRVPLALLRARAEAGAAPDAKPDAERSAEAGSADATTGGIAAKADSVASAEEAAEATPPHEGHPTSRVFGGGGTEQGRGFARLEVRPVLHDFLDDDAGYLPNSRLLLGDTTVEYQTGPSSSLRLQDLTVAEVATLPHWNTLLHPWSWQIGGGLLRPEDTGCVSCLAGSLRAAGGLAMGVGPLMGYAFARGDVQVSSVFSPFFRAGPSAELGGIYAPLDRVKLHVEFARTWFMGGSIYWRMLAEGEFEINRSITLQLSGERLTGNVADLSRVIASLGIGF